MIPFNKPYLSGKETSYIEDAVNSGKISGNGKYTKLCQDFFEKRYEFKKCLLTTSCTDALEMCAILANIEIDDEVIIPSYTFVSTALAFIRQGAKIIFADSNSENPNIDATKLEALITPKTKAILICNPGNPTGYLYSQEEILKLAEIVKKHDLFLIADEVYREFIYDGDKHFSVMNVPGLEEHAIMIDSVSKRYSMCGARIGCIVSKNKEVMATAMKFAQARLSPPTYAQIASEAALETPQSYFDAVISEYKDRRDTLIAELNKIDGVIVASPKGAFYCIAKLPIDNADKFAQWLLESYDFNGETVMVAPAAGFYSTPNVGLDEVRIAYVLKKDDLIKSVKILKEALNTYNKL